VADNVAITPGSGASIAADDISGVLYQRIKLAWGSDGSAVDTSATDPLPVTAPAAARTTHAIAVALQSDVLMNSLTAMTPLFFSATVAASQTDIILVTGVSGSVIRVVALAAQCGSSATTLTLESDGAPDVRKHVIPAGANGGQILPFNPVGWFQNGQGNALLATTSAGSSFEISGVYVLV
jgi:hypothetical protein